MTKEKSTFRPLKSKHICLVYSLLHAEGLVSFPLHESVHGKIDGIVANINNAYFGESIYVNTPDKVVAYLYFLIKDHPFTDGNKRTAVLSFEILCSLNNLEPDYSSFRLDELVVYIEGVKVLDHQSFIKDLSRALFPNRK